jgi:UDP-N-acetylglucosamine:LPS N-acetylglucosamine transferase
MGAGHDGAAKELRKRLESSGHRVEVIDFLDAVAFRIGPVLRWFYQVQLRLFPWSYELSYRMSPVLRAPAVAVDTLLTRRRLRRTIKDFRPDTIVSVYPLASLVLGRMRRKKTLRVPVVTYLTDFAVHSLWVHPGIDRHLAVSELSARAASARGGRDARARGPLVSDRFRDRSVERDAVRHALGLDPRDRAVLVVAGSWGVGDVVATVEAIGSEGRFHPITVCGRDEKLRDELEARGYGTVIGWTDDMPALMVAADALVENAGGLTCMEAFAVGLPVISYLPIAGHGKDNAEMMSRAGVNAYARDAAHLQSLLDSVTTPGLERDRMVHAGYELFTGDPALEVAALASTNVSVDRKGRVVPLRTPAPRKTVWITAATIAILYSGLTLGAQAVSAIGVGTAKPPETARDTAYLGVRLDGDQLEDPALLDTLSELDVTVVVDALTARDHSAQLEALLIGGVSIANGGWGKGTFLRWNRARNDVDRASEVIAREAGTETHEFVPGRRLDAFDRYYAGRTEQKLVVPNDTFGPDDVPVELEPSKVYLLDGRGRDLASMEHALDLLARRFDRAHVHAGSLEELR